MAASLVPPKKKSVKNLLIVKTEKLRQDKWRHLNKPSDLRWKWLNTRRTCLTVVVRALNNNFCFCWFTKTTHYWCIIVIEAKINDLHNRAGNKAQACAAESWVPEVVVSSLQSVRSDALEMTQSLRVILMNAWGIFTECKCENAEIHLDFRSPSESIRGGSMSICYSLTWHKGEDGPLTSYLDAACVCLQFYIEPAVPGGVLLPLLLIFVAIPPSASADIHGDSAFVMSPEGPLDCRNMKKILAIAAVLSLLAVGAPSCRLKPFLNNGP